MGVRNPPRHRSLTPEELELWRAFTGSVEPLSGAASRKSPRSRARDRVATSLLSSRVSPTKCGDISPQENSKDQQRTSPSQLRRQDSKPVIGGLDRKNTRALAKGRLSIERRLDLHGLTLDDAHRRLTQVIDHCIVKGIRRLLVITGKGRGGEGVLRRKVPRWLETAPLRNAVLAIATAEARHGGEGALYVFLRRSSGGKTS